MPDTPGPEGRPVPSYKVTVNLQFTDGAGNTNPDLQKKYEEAARKCYAAATGDLAGKLGALEIRLASDEPSVPKPTITQKISIVSSTSRADSHNWETNMDQSDRCPVILHETLHLLGLVDEYKETSIGVLVNKETGERKDVSDKATHASYNCRALGPDDSIMANHIAGSEAVKAHDVLVTCSCASGNQACNAAVAKTVTDRGTTCPSGSTRGRSLSPAWQGKQPGRGKHRPGRPNRPGDLLDLPARQARLDSSSSAVPRDHPARLPFSEQELLRLRQPGLRDLTGQFRGRELRRGSAVGLQGRGGGLAAVSWLHPAWLLLLTA